MRELELWFTGGATPALYETVFRHPYLSDVAGQEQHAVRGKDEGAHPRHYGSFQWSRAVQALAVFMLGWAAWARRPKHNGFAHGPTFQGMHSTPASSLNYALSKKNDWLCDMFGYDEEGDPIALKLIRRTNPDLKRPGTPVGLSLNTPLLPPGNIKVFLDGKSIDDTEQLDNLAQDIASRWGAPGTNPGARAGTESATLGQLPCPGAPASGGAVSPGNPPARPDTPNVGTEVIPGVRIKIKLDRDLDTYPAEEQNRLLAVIRVVHRCSSAVLIAKKRGCVELTLQLAPEEAERLLWIAKSGALDDFGVVVAEVVPSLAEQEAVLSKPLTGRAPRSTGQGGWSEPSHEEDEELVLMLQDPVAAGRAWEVFVDRYGPKIYGWCRRWRLQDADARDVTQEVLCKLVEQIQTLQCDPARSFRGWLYRVTHHALCDVREARKRPGQGSGHGDVEGLLLNVEARQDLVQHLDEVFDRELLERAMQQVRLRVKPATWQAFALVSIQGVPREEAARQLGMQVGTLIVYDGRVKWMLQKAVARLEGRPGNDQKDEP
jgi:RNA polymerase sigma factor (sigma-70 family)